MADAIEGARECLRATISAHNAAADADIYIWPDEEYAVVAAMIAFAQQAPKGWEPIETAPKDGTWFLAAQDGEIYPCQWLREEYDEGAPHEGWYDLFNQSFEGPTHFRPLPAPPAMLDASPSVGEEYE